MAFIIILVRGVSNSHLAFILFVARQVLYYCLCNARGYMLYYILGQNGLGLGVQIATTRRLVLAIHVEDRRGCVCWQELCSTHPSQQETLHAAPKLSSIIPRDFHVRQLSNTPAELTARSWSEITLLWTAKTIIPIRILKSMRGTLQRQICARSVKTAHELV